MGSFGRVPFFTGFRWNNEMPLTHNGASPLQSPPGIREPDSARLATPHCPSAPRGTPSPCAAARDRPVPVRGPHPKQMPRQAPGRRSLEGRLGGKAHPVSYRMWYTAISHESSGEYRRGDEQDRATMFSIDCRSEEASAGRRWIFQHGPIGGRRGYR